MDNREGGIWLREHAVFRDLNSTQYVNGAVQAITRRAGSYIHNCENSWWSGIQCGSGATSENGYRLNSPQYRDVTYSLIDGVNDDISWDGTKPFAVISHVQPLDAPTQSLSSTLKINPLDVIEPTLPKLPDPSKINSGNSVDQKDIPLPAKVNIDQNVKNDVKAPSETKTSVGNTTQSKGKASGVLAQEVSADFDDGEGFKDPIYASQSVSTLGRSSFAIWTFTNYSNDADSYVYNLVDANKAYFDSKIQEHGPNSMKFLDENSNVLTGHVRQSLNNVTNFIDTYMSPGKQLEMYKTLLDMLKNDVNGTLKGKTVTELAGLGVHIPKLVAVGQIKNVEAYLWAYAEIRQAKGEVVKAELDIGFAIATAPTPEGVIAIGKSAAKLLSKEGLKGVKALSESILDIAKNWFKKGCKTPCCNSFTPTTLIRTLNGLVAISALTLGISVLAYNEQTGQNGYYPITAVHKNNDPAITYLEIKDPEQGGKSEFITTTPEHPFYLQVNADASARPKPQGHEDLSSKWVGAGHLKKGDQVKQADGTTGVIANVVTVKQTQQMYNLTVSEAHTFFVGADGWLVHNTGSGGCPALIGDPYHPAAVDASVQAGRTARTTQPITYIKGQRVEVSPGTTVKMDVDLSPTISNIRSGNPVYPQDGTIYGGSGLAPRSYGYYKEYVVPTPGMNGAGSQRIVVGSSGEMYYTANHYQSFTQLVPNR